MRELPGITLLGDEVCELGILGIDVLEENSERVADILVVCQTKRLAGNTHNLAVVADHVVRLTSFFLNSLLQLSFYHFRIPTLAGLHPQYTHIGMF